MELDVTDNHSVKAFAAARFGRIDVLINNAGVMLLSPLSALKTDEWDRMVDVNVKGVLWRIGAVLPTMTEQGSGQIIAIGSEGPISPRQRPPFIACCPPSHRSARRCRYKRNHHSANCDRIEGNIFDHILSH